MAFGFGLAEDLYESGAHPRLLVGPDDVAALRKRIAAGPGKKLMDALRVAEEFERGSPVDDAIRQGCGDELLRRDQLFIRPARPRRHTSFSPTSRAMSMGGVSIDPIGGR